MYENFEEPQTIATTYTAVAFVVETTEGGLNDGDASLVQ
jgi:hypothetical protein